MRSIRFIFATLLLALGAGSAMAGPVPSTEVSPLALSTIDYAPVLATVVSVGNSDYTNAAWTTTPTYPRGENTRNDAIRYRNRGGYRSRYNPVESPVQINLGFFDPDGEGGGSFELGLRGGPMVDPHIQIGGGIEWMHRTEDQTVVAGDPYTQGGTTVTPTRVLSRASADLVPFQLFMQVSGEPDMPVIPYAGISGGYEVMFLSADDFATGQSFDATFGGWGWQAWLGAGVPLSGQTRLTGEVFANQSNPEREVTDLNGNTYRERIDADGVGMRFGLQFGF